MASASPSFQLLFLVDLNFSRHRGKLEGGIEKLSYPIRSAALKLLAYLAGKVRYNYKQLQWGYQLFNTASATHSRSCRGSSGFKEFDIKSFEEFENQIAVALEKWHITSQQSEERADLGHDEETEAIEVLADSLRELLYKFQWDNPDISSPIKKVHRSLRTRSNSHLDIKVEQNTFDGMKSNIVFLLTYCPHELENVLNFASCTNDSLMLLKSFLPSQIYREFHHSCQIHLFWINGNLELPVKDTEGAMLMHQALQHVGGGLIPISTLLGLDYYLYPKGKNLQKNELNPTEFLGIHTDTGCSLLTLPLTSVMDHFLQGVIKNDLRTDSTVSVTSDAAVLHISKGDKIYHVDHVTHEKICSSGRYKTREPTDTVGLWMTSQKPSSAIDEGDGYATGQIAIVTPGGGSLKSRSPCRSAPLVPTLHVRGTLGDGHQLLPDLDQRDVSMVTISGSSGAGFTRLLKGLCLRGVVAIVEYRLTHTDLPRLGLLRPLTSACASLTLLASPLAARLDDLVRDASVSDAQDAASDFRTVSGEVMTSPVDQDRHEMSAGQVNNFNPAMLELWFHRHPPTRSLTDHLQDSRGDEEAEAGELSFLKQLQRKLVTARSRRLNGLTPQAADHVTNHVTGHMTWTRAGSALRESAGEDHVLREGGTTSPGGASAPPGRSGGRKTPRKKGPSPQALRRSPRKAVREARVRETEAPCTRRGYLATTKGHTLRGRTHTAPSRVDLILARSKQAQQAPRDKEPRAGEKPKPGHRRTQTAKDQAAKISTEEELARVVTSLHEEALYGGGSTEDASLKICAVVKTFVQGSERPDGDTASGPDSSNMVAAAALLKKHVTLSAADVGRKYKTTEDSGVKCKEYEIQSLLHLELAGGGEWGQAEDDRDNSLQQAVMMLRALSFIKDPGHLNDFLSRVIQTRYLESAPRMLRDLYDELGQPLPLALKGLFSSDADSDTDGDAGTDTASGPGSNLMSVALTRGSCQGPPSAGTRAAQKLQRRSSFQVSGARQIRLPGRQQTRKKETKCRKSAAPRSAAKPRSRSQKQSPSDSADAKFVRRNLFSGGGSPTRRAGASPTPRAGASPTRRAGASPTRRAGVSPTRRAGASPTRRAGASPTRRGGTKLERRQSVAVMETGRPRGRDSKRRERALKKSPSATPKGGRRSMVSETPAHRQKINALWRRQEQRRQRSQTVTNVRVIEESPEKPANPGSEGALSAGALRSPRRARLMRRSSFYSGSTGSRNVEKYRRLEARMTERSLLSPRGPGAAAAAMAGMLVGLPTPRRRIQPVSLFSNLLQPSPQKAAAHGATLRDAMTPVKQRAPARLLDSPSRNTRSQMALLVGSPGVVGAPCGGTPQRPAGDPRRATLSTPSKSGGASSAVCSLSFDSPSSRTRLRTHLEQDSGRGIQNSPLRPGIGILNSPRRSGIGGILNFPLRPGIGILNSPLRSGIGILNSPLRSGIGILNSPLRSGIGILNSPLRSAARKTPVSQAAVKLNFDSPSKCTRSKMAPEQTETAIQKVGFPFKSASRSGRSDSPATKALNFDSPVKSSRISCTLGMNEAPKGPISRSASLTQSPCKSNAGVFNSGSTGVGELSDGGKGQDRSRTSAVELKSPTTPFKSPTRIPSHSGGSPDLGLDTPSKYTRSRTKAVTELFGPGARYLGHTSQEQGSPVRVKVTPCKVTLGPRVTTPPAVAKMTRALFSSPETKFGKVQDAAAEVTTSAVQAAKVTGVIGLTSPTSRKVTLSSPPRVKGSVTTPPQGRKRTRSTRTPPESPLDKWPRRKPRTPQQQQLQPCPEAICTIGAPPTTAVDGQQEDESAILRRRVKPCVRRVRLIPLPSGGDSSDTWLKEGAALPLDDTDDTAPQPHTFHPPHTPRSKRKLPLDVEADGLTPTSDFLGTPTKRQRISLTEILASQDAANQNRAGADLSREEVFLGAVDNHGDVSGSAPPGGLRRTLLRARMTETGVAISRSESVTNDPASQGHCAEAAAGKSMTFGDRLDAMESTGEFSVGSPEREGYVSPAAAAAAGGLLLSPSRYPLRNHHGTGATPPAKARRLEPDVTVTSQLGGGGGVTGAVSLAPGVAQLLSRGHSWGSDSVPSPILQTACSPARVPQASKGATPTHSTADSPVFGSPVLNRRCSPRATQSPALKVTDKHLKVKDFSPKLSSTSICHLMNSPLLEAGNKGALHPVTAPTEGALSPPTTPKRSRRSLYRTQTKLSL